MFQLHPVWHVDRRGILGEVPTFPYTAFNIWVEGVTAGLSYSVLGERQAYSLGQADRPGKCLSPLRRGQKWHLKREGGIVLMDCDLEQR
jgi:hypothetical protein